MQNDYTRQNFGGPYLLSPLATSMC